MVRVLVVASLIALLGACHDRLGPNDLLVPTTARVLVGTPVYAGFAVVGRVARTRQLGDHVRVTFHFEADSLAPDSLAQLRLRSVGLGEPVSFVIESAAPRPVFGPGGFVPGAPRDR